jgi:hypothetical protein
MLGQSYCEETAIYNKGLDKSRKDDIIKREIEFTLNIHSQEQAEK